MCLASSRQAAVLPLGHRPKRVQWCWSTGVFSSCWDQVPSGGHSCALPTRWGHIPQTPTGICVRWVCSHVSPHRQEISHWQCGLAGEAPAQPGLPARRLLTSRANLACSPGGASQPLGFTLPPCHRRGHLITAEQAPGTRTHSHAIPCFLLTVLQVKLSGKIGCQADIALIEDSLLVTAIGEPVLR